MTLQSQGWSLSAEQDMMRNTMRIAVEHQGAGMRGISDHIPWHFEQVWHEYPGPVRLPPIRLHLMGRDIHYRVQGSLDWNFQPIDAMPHVVSTEIKRLEDLVHFGPSLVRTKGIIVPEETVPELMERILKLQQPEREAEFLRQAQEGRDITAGPRQKFHAQILSLAA